MKLDFNLANDILNEIMTFKRDIEKTLKTIENVVTLSIKTIENIKNDMLIGDENK
jgi:hypothetical protein